MIYIYIIVVVIYMLYISCYIYVYIYTHIVFTTERLLEVAIEFSPEWYLEVQNQCLQMVSPTVKFY